jgi:hypothetical protein
MRSIFVAALHEIDHIVPKGNCQQEIQRILA